MIDGKTHFADDATIAYIASLQKQVSEIGQLGISLREQRDELLEALLDVLNRIEKSDQWWMDCPSHGGFPVPKIRAAIAKCKEGT